MTQEFQRFTKRYVNVLGVFIGVAVVSSILFSSGCMSSSPRNPTPPPDRSAPTSAITSPASGANLSTGTAVSITGTASDAGGTVARVEVSVDGGATFSAATGTTAWSFTWTTPATPGQVKIRSRAVDNSGNMQNPPAEITVTVRIPIRVPSEQPTIQSAIDVATDGDIVLVAPGTYFENIDFKGKAITVTSESGAEVTFIDGRNEGSVVSFISGEGGDSALHGFTVQNGNVHSGSFVGGGIVVRNSSPTITNNRIMNNRAANFGGGIVVQNSSPRITNNMITNNNACGGSGIGVLIFFARLGTEMGSSFQTASMVRFAQLLTWSSPDRYPFVLPKYLI